MMSATLAACLFQLRKHSVIFNLKSHLAASLAKDILEDVAACNMFIKS